MTTAATETETKTRASGPRVWKDTPTNRERVICESLAKSINELTGKDVDAETVRAVRFSTSRWYDSVGKDLMQNMGDQLKRAEAQSKLEKLQKALREAEAELNTYDSDGDSDEDDNFNDVDSDEDEEDEDDGEDLFADDDDEKKVSASF